jgi:alkylation response protein AidB-like acyl-CoA dehydrogenase
MNFELTEEHLAVKEAARDFAQNILKPGVIERDNQQKFPAEEIKQLGELGFMGMMVDPKYGGSGMDTLSYVLAMEEISKVDASTSVCMSVNNSLVCWGLETFGSEEQKQKYLIPLAKGEKIGAFCLSEPEAGSDATSQRTTAIDMGDHYLLNGTKNWITNGSSASVYLVIAQTNTELGHKGINALIVERGMEGFIIGAKRKPHRRRRLRFQICHENAFWRPYRYCCSSTWYCRRWPRVVFGLCKRASGFRKRNFQAPSYCFQTRRHGYRN